MRSVDLNMEKVKELGLINFLKEAKEASRSELINIADDIERDIDNIGDVVNMWSNNGRGWVDEGTHEHAMDMCDQAEEDLPELETKLDIVEYFLQNK